MSARRREVIEPYATAPFVTVRNVDGEPVQEPNSEVHAKMMGTNVTLCGKVTSAWVKFLDRPFYQFTGGRCEACVQAYLKASESQASDPH
jgi:hypothetical protein